MDQKLAELDIPDDLWNAVFKLIDRRHKMKPDAWDRHAEEQGLSAVQIDGLNLLLKNENLWKESEELKDTMEVLDIMGWGDYIEYEASTIRGLDYYTGLVFEAVEVTGGRAILGGGHYDNLVGDVGGEPLPGVGFAMGDVLIKIIIKNYDLLPDFQNRNKKVVMVTVFDKSLQIESIRLASELRQEGIDTAIYPEPAKLLKQFKYADRKGMNYAIVLGPDEISQNVVSIKDLKTRKQETFDRSKLISKIKRMLA